MLNVIITLTFFKQPPANDVNSWCQLCFGRIKPPPRKGEPVESDGITDEAGAVRHDGILPLVSTVIAMDQPTVIKVLEYHLNWFEATGFSDKQVRQCILLLCYILGPVKLMIAKTVDK